MVSCVTLLRVPILTPGKRVFNNIRIIFKFLYYVYLVKNEDFEVFVILCLIFPRSIANGLVISTGGNLVNDSKNLPYILQTILTKGNIRIQTFIQYCN